MNRLFRRYITVLCGVIARSVSSSPRTDPPNRIPNARTNVTLPTAASHISSVPASRHWFYHDKYRFSGKSVPCQDADMRAKKLYAETQRAWDIARLTVIHARSIFRIYEIVNRNAHLFNDWFKCRSITFLWTMSLTRGTRQSTMTPRVDSQPHSLWISFKTRSTNRTRSMTKTPSPDHKLSTFR